MAKFWRCRWFGHKLEWLPFLPESKQNWYDIVCVRCGVVHTVMGGHNQ